MKFYNQSARALVLVAALSIAALGTAQMRSLDSTQNGRGKLTFQTGRSVEFTVRRVRVILRSDHSAEIRILSGGNETFSGTWKGGGVYQVYLDIDHVNRDRAGGSGQVTHDARGEFTRASCTGTVGDRHFDFSFDANNNFRPDHEDHHGNLSDKRLLESAHLALRDKFPGYDLSFAKETVGRELFGNRTVKGKFRARGRGHRDTTYNYVVVCNSRTGVVRSVDYSRK